MKRKAFTILEVLLVVAIFGLLVTAAVPQTLRYFFGQELEVETQKLVHLLRRAQSQSQLQLEDSAWGMYFDTSTDTLTFFAGSTYATRTPDYDMFMPLAPGVSFGTFSLNGGGTELVFDQLTGATSQYGSFDLNGSDNTSRTISINSLGRVTSD